MKSAFDWVVSVMAGRWLVLAWLAVSVACLATAYGYGRSHGSAAVEARWEAATREAGERFASALEAQQGVLAGLAKELDTSRRRAYKSRENYADAVKGDPAARDWDSQRIPDSVRRALGDPAVPADPG
jgi:hypothetical protein